MITTESHFEDIHYEIIRELRRAQYSISICVAWISSDIYGPILYDLSKKGVKVEVIYYECKSNKKMLQHKKNENYFIYAFTPRTTKTIMHNKFCIIDHQTLITGSFNWSSNAQNHFENIVIIRNDFPLVKSFMHEFQDLKHHLEYQKPGTVQLEKCFCKGNQYNIGVLGYEKGKYSESEVQIWGICFANYHVTLLEEKYENFLSSRLFDEKSEEDFELEEAHKDAMLDNYKREREEMQRVQDYFSENHKYRIHAIATKTISNFTGNTKFDEDPDWQLKMLWKNMYYRKSIPSYLYDGQGDIERIIYNRF